MSLDSNNRSAKLAEGIKSHWRINNGKYFLFAVISSLVVFLYFFGVGGDALNFLEWFLSSAKAFVSALLNFFNWILP